VQYDLHENQNKHEHSYSTGRVSLIAGLDWNPKFVFCTQLKGDHFRGMIAALIACGRAEEFLM